MSPDPAFAVLLAAPHPVAADLARNLLEAAGIPSLLHGPGPPPAALVEFGFLQPAVLPDLLVPAPALERAREVLVEAWGSLDPRDG